MALLNVATGSGAFSVKDSSNAYGFGSKGGYKRSATFDAQSVLTTSHVASEIRPMNISLLPLISY